MASVFTRIINSELPGEIVYADDACVVLMDIQPQAPGHVLVIPREEIDHWIDLPDDLRDHLFAVAQRVGGPIQRAFEAGRCGLVIAGYGVPHTHLHVIPINEISDLDPARATAIEPERLAADATKVREALRGVGISVNES